LDILEKKYFWTNFDTKINFIDNPRILLTFFFIFIFLKILFKNIFFFQNCFKKSQIKFKIINYTKISKNQISVTITNFRNFISLHRMFRQRRRFEQRLNLVNHRQSHRRPQRLNCPCRNNASRSQSPVFDANRARMRRRTHEIIAFTRRARSTRTIWQWFSAI
jgi:hypothetical protein